MNQVKVELKKRDQQMGGFTLLELILSISVLLTLSIAATTVIRGSLQMKEGISDQAEMTHKMSLIMQKITNDLSGVFILDTRTTELKFDSRATKSLFAVRRDGASYELAFTAMNHRARVKNAHESDQTYIVYKIMTDEKNTSGVTNLYRGETSILPSNFDEKIPMSLLAYGIKSMTIHCWNGDKWSDDRWDSLRSEWRNKLPQMVKIDMEIYELSKGAIEAAGAEKADFPTSVISTVVYLPRANGIQEVKARSTRVQWSGG